MKPYGNDDPSDHLGELKQIPEVAIFFSTYEKYGIQVSYDDEDYYEIHFEATSKEMIVSLDVRFYFGIPSDIFYSCGDVEEEHIVSYQADSEIISSINCLELEKVLDSEKQ